MSKITFPGGGGGGGGAGVSDHGGLAGLGDDDHAQYLLQDGTRLASGLALHSGIVPANSGEGHIGLASAPFSSGVFKASTTNLGICLWNGVANQSPGLRRNTDGSLEVAAANGNQTTLRANQFVATASISAGSNGQRRWDGRARIDSPTVSGVRILDNNSTSHAYLQVSGIKLIAPNGSGWLLTVDNDGVLQTAGPEVL